VPFVFLISARAPRAERTCAESPASPTAYSPYPTTEKRRRSD
jgi:hypothetical protein